jgi:hypothetical protein
MDQSQLDQFQLALPPHLTERDKSRLLEQLRDFPGPASFFGATNDDEPVQGDAWRGFITLQFPSGEQDRVMGLVISNSCDITRENNPAPDQKILFAPLVDLAAYEALLYEQGKNEDYVESHLGMIRNQEIHRIFYVPNNGELGGESIVLLDDIHAQPISSLNVTRAFSLSNYGWYVLLMKLSVHFTRMTDGVQRGGMLDAVPVPA